MATRPGRPKPHRSAGETSPVPSDTPTSLIGVMAAAVLEETYRSLDETYASLGLARWNQPPAVALWQARHLESAEALENQLDAPARAPRS